MILFFWRKRNQFNICILGRWIVQKQEKKKKKTKCKPEKKNEVKNQCQLHINFVQSSSTDNYTFSPAKTGILHGYFSALKCFHAWSAWASYSFISFYFFTLYHLPSFVYELELHLPGFAFALVFFCFYFCFSNISNVDPTPNYSCRDCPPAVPDYNLTQVVGLFFPPSFSFKHVWICVSLSLSVFILGLGMEHEINSWIYFTKE